MIKIAISGRMNTGKSTLSEMLAKHLGLEREQVQIAGLADPMKNAVLQIFPYAKKENLFGPSALRSEVIDQDLLDHKGRPLTYRQVLLDLGKWGRAYNQNVWLRALAYYANTSTEKQACVISDVRYCNEFQYLRKEGFYMIRLKRQTTSISDDVSETEQANIPDEAFHTIIENYGSLEELDMKAQAIAGNIIKSAL